MQIFLSERKLQFISLWLFPSSCMHSRVCGWTSANVNASIYFMLDAFVELSRFSMHITAESPMIMCSKLLIRLHSLCFCFEINWNNLLVLLHLITSTWFAIWFSTQMIPLCLENPHCSESKGELDFLGRASCSKSHSESVAALPIFNLFFVAFLSPLASGCQLSTHGYIQPLPSTSFSHSTSLVCLLWLHFRVSPFDFTKFWLLAIVSLLIFLLFC